MRTLAKLAAVLCLAALAFAAPPATLFHFHVAGDEPGPWPAILTSIGLVEGGAGASGILVVRSGPADAAPQWLKRADAGAIIVVEGDSELAQALGFKPGRKRVPVRNVLDSSDSKLAIVWEKALELPVWELPKEAEVFAKERWTGAPLVGCSRKECGGSRKSGRSGSPSSWT